MNKMNVATLLLTLVSASSGEVQLRSLRKLSSGSSSKSDKSESSGSKSKSGKSEIVCESELDRIAALEARVAELEGELAACLATEGPTSKPTQGPSKAPSSAPSSSPTSNPTHAPSFSTTIVFVTSERYAGGAFGGVDGAHSICQRLASDAGLPGVYKAWISDGSYSPATNFTRSSLPYVLVDGTAVADDWNNLIAPTSQCPSTGPGYVGGTDCLQSAIDKDEQGNATDSIVWTGTKADGTVGENPVELGFPDCNGWTSSDASSFGLRGGTLRVDFRWTAANAFANSQENGPCSDAYRLYCFQQ